MISLKINLWFAFKINLIFILFTVIGTLTHELGHVAAAKLIGHETEVGYGSMIHYPKGYMEDSVVISFNEFLKKNNKVPFEDWNEKLKAELNDYKKKLTEKFDWSNGIWVTLGGPLETFLTAFFGLVILWHRKTIYKQHLQFVDWLAIVLSLFALREIFNTVTAIVLLILYGSKNFRGDEFVISRYLELNQWVIPLLTASLGLLITIYVLFRVLPLKYRFSFIIGGFAGGIAGFYIWFGFLGEWCFNGFVKI